MVYVQIDERGFPGSSNTPSERLFRETYVLPSSLYSSFNRTFLDGRPGSIARYTYGEQRKQASANPSGQLVFFKYFFLTSCKRYVSHVLRGRGILGMTPGRSSDVWYYRDLELEWVGTYTLGENTKQGTHSHA